MSTATQVIPNPAPKILKNPVAGTTVLQICCPNCGRPAERHYLHDERLTRTQCPSCDYLMILCADTGKVIEAYALGITTLH